MTRLALLSTGIALFCHVTHLQGLTISKCCKEQMMFDAGLDCVDMTKTPPNEFQWFPFASVIDLANVARKNSMREELVRMLRNATVLPGSQPECSDSEKDATYFNLTKPLFNLLLLRGNEMRVHMSAEKTLHNLSLADSFADFSSPASLRTFPMDDVCVDATPQGHGMIICPCRTVTCIRKCCSDKKLLNISKEDCEPLQNSPHTKNLRWRPNYFEDDGNKHYYLLSSTYPSCEHPLLLKMPIEKFKHKLCNRFTKDSDNDFVIFNNGSVKVRKYKKLYESDQYCGETTWHEGGKIYEQNLLICSAITENLEHRPVKFLIYGILLIVGGICLLITVSVSLYLPDLRRRIHNKIALSHNSSLMIAYFAWGCTQLSVDLGDTTCIILSLLIQFTFLGSFFWLNVMCIDISMTFSSNRTLGSTTAKGESKKFMYYCIYAWGTTSVISIFTVFMEFLPEVPNDVLRPGFTCSCGFNNASASILIYFYGPMSVLLVFNLFLFVFTTIKIMRIQRQTAILHKTDSNTTGGSSFQSDKQRYDIVQWLILYAKLFLLMGLTWVTEIVSWAIGGSAYYWYFTDILNLLRGVFIFIIFICKKSVLVSLKRKLKGESFSASNKTASSKSTSDVLSVSTTGRDSRLRSSTSSRRNNSENRAYSKRRNSDESKM